jgi:hypothetical protein
MGYSTNQRSHNGVLSQIKLVSQYRKGGDGKGKQRKKEHGAATTDCSDGLQIPRSSFNPKTSPVFTEPRKQVPCSEPGK